MNFDFYYKNSGLLHGLRITRSGDVETVIYPEITNGFTGYTSINGVLYILDEVADTVYRWNEGSGEWVDLADSMAMPSGEYTGLYSFYNNPVVGTAEGLWYLALNSYQLSFIAPAAGPVMRTPVGYYQLVISSEDLNFKAIPFSNGDGANVAFEDMLVSSEDYSYSGYAYGETGAVSIFELKVVDDAESSDDDAEELESNLLVWTTEEGHQVIEAPRSTTNIKGCFTSYPQLFCVYETTDNYTVLFELKNGEFRADTILGSIASLAGVEIKSIKAIGSKRYGVISKQVGESVEYSSIVSDSLASRMITTDVYSLDSNMFAFFSLEAGVVNILGYEAGLVGFSKIKHSGPTEYQENTFDGADSYTFIASRDGEIEDEVKFVPKAEIAGNLSFGILFFMLILLAGRRSSFK